MNTDKGNGERPFWRTFNDSFINEPALGSETGSEGVIGQHLAHFGAGEVGLVASQAKVEQASRLPYFIFQLSIRVHLCPSVVNSVSTSSTRLSG
jgi:hypothetical protein